MKCKIWAYAIIAVAAAGCGGEPGSNPGGTNDAGGGSEAGGGEGGETPPPAPGFRQSSPNPLNCTDAKTLENLTNCIVSHFGQFLPASATEQSEARTVIRAMLNGNCETIVLPSTLGDIVSVRSFVDGETFKTYCVLMEVKDADDDTKVDRGWGATITDTTPRRELNIAIAHPVDDSKTEEQGIGVFKATGSRTFFLAGARRDVGTPSACQPDSAHSSSDAAHNTATMFYAATQELNDWYGSQAWHQIQFHGMAATTCPGVAAYLTYGSKAPPLSGEVILSLKTNLLKDHPTWSVTVPGDSPSCTLSATTNVQGRFLNGIAADLVCNQSAPTYSQKFISIEQAPGFRLAADWAAAIEDTWPSL